MYTLCLFVHLLVFLQSRADFIIFLIPVFVNFYNSVNILVRREYTVIQENYIENTETLKKKKKRHANETSDAVMQYIVSDAKRT